MRRAAVNAACVVLLAGPTVLAFFSGGYFDGPREVAGAVAWALVAVGLLLEPRPFALSRPAGIAVVGLALFAGWTLLSIVWADIAGNAYHAGQIAMLYLGALLAAAVLIRRRSLQMWVVPALAAGILIVIGYGLAGRMLPGVVHLARSLTALGRLEQPLTYWNAMGELAAMGLVLCAAAAGDERRHSLWRAAAAGAAVPVGLGLYLSYSRGALFAAGAGLLALVVIARRREQLASVVLIVIMTALVSVLSAPFPGVTSLSGTLARQERDGAIVLALAVALALVCAALQYAVVSRRRGGALRLPRRAPMWAAGVICVVLALAIAAGAQESSAQSHPLSGGATRLVTLQSNRYAYWNVALRVFVDHPLIGVGGGNWAVFWLRDRHISEFASDAHSLPLQTMAELGVIGLALLLAFVVGVARAGGLALQRGAPVAGALAALTTYLVHAPLDWDWEMPAVTLVAIILAGMVLAGSGREDAMVAQ